MTMSDIDEADELLLAAETGAARCMAHGHRFDGTGTVPVVVELPGEKLEVYCRSCAEHYDKEVVREGSENTERTDE